MKHVVPQHGWVLVYVVDCQHHRRHHSSAHSGFRDVASIREETGNVDVSSLVSGKIRLLGRYFCQLEAQQHHKAENNLHGFAESITFCQHFKIRFLLYNCSYGTPFSCSLIRMNTGFSLHQLSTKNFCFSIVSLQLVYSLQ